MKISIISDLHCEFHEDGGKKFCEDFSLENCDALVIAGDFSTNRYLVRNLTILLKKEKNIIMVKGNHELYGASRGKVNNNLLKLGKRFSNFYHLDKSIAVIDGHRFLGATLWFRNHPMNAMFLKMMNDIHCIPGFKKWNYAENAACIKFFEESMREGDICISHHAPSEAGVSPLYVREKDMNRFYFCNMEELIFQKKPALWVNGHVHDAASYEIGETRIRSNPHGYMTELRSSKWKEMIIEVP